MLGTFTQASGQTISNYRTTLSWEYVSGGGGVEYFCFTFKFEDKLK